MKDVVVRGAAAAAAAAAPSRYALKDGLKGIIGGAAKPAGPAANPHEVVYGRPADPFFILYKPPSLPLVGGDFSKDSLAQRLSKTASFYFPVPLADEEEGLQMVTPLLGIHKALELYARLGFMKFGYSTLHDLPQCFRHAAAPTCPLCRRGAGAPQRADAVAGEFRALRDALAAAKSTGGSRAQAQRFTLTAQALTDLAGSQRRSAEAGERAKSRGARVSALFGGDAGGGDDGGSGVCAGCGRGGGITGAAAQASAAGVELQCGVVARVSPALAGLSISTRACEGAALRATLAGHGIPVHRDPVFNTPYANELAAGAGAARRHTELTLTSPFHTGTGFARSGITLPDPSSSRMFEFLKRHHPLQKQHLGVAEDSLPFLTVSVPRPDSWDAVVSGGIVNKSLARMKQDAVVRQSTPASGADLDTGERSQRQRKQEIDAQRCLHCAGAHQVAQCPELNGLGKTAVLRNTLAGAAQMPGNGLYCTICSDTMHEDASCSRRKYGANPAKQCGFCGSLYHSVLECDSAHKAGLGSLSRANEYAQSIGFESYREFVQFKKAGERTREFGNRPAMTVLGSSDDTPFAAKALSASKYSATSPGERVVVDRSDRFSKNRYMAAGKPERRAAGYRRGQEARNKRFSQRNEAKEPFYEAGGVDFSAPISV